MKDKGEKGINLSSKGWKKHLMMIICFFIGMYFHVFYSYLSEIFFIAYHDDTSGSDDYFSSTTSEMSNQDDDGDHSKKSKEDNILKGYYDSMDDEHDNVDVWTSLDILTSGTIMNTVQTKKVKCPAPLVPFDNIIVRPVPIDDNENNATTTNQQEYFSNSRRRSKIPKILHFSMNSRCLPRDHVITLKRWQTVFPNHSIFFHDDEAVEKFINEEDWNEFPNFHRAMQCIISKGAMKIDVWRVLVLYRYGGIYSDIDNWPTDLLNETTIPANVSSFFLSDAWNRPSQWFMALEPRHPMMYLAMQEIIENLLEMDDIVYPKVVFVTGPNVMRSAFKKFYDISFEEQAHKDPFGPTNGIMMGAYKKPILKYTNNIGRECKGCEYIRGDKYIKSKKGYSDIVRFNETLNVTRGERIELESGVLHWTKQIQHANAARGGLANKLSCQEHLATIENQ
jgi:hypothetical protein